MIRTTAVVIASILGVIFSSALAQEHEHHEHPTNSSSMMMKSAFGSYSMSRDSSGTSWQPDGSSMEGPHWMGEQWTTMLHGSLTGVFDHQSGPRGDDAFFGNNMMGVMTWRNMGWGSIGVRSMISLEPLMIQDPGYPLLLQVGETVDGKTHLIDRQHPHDLFMELALHASFNISDKSSIFAYVGYPGEPAIGPPAFPHRASGMEIPEAAISHHWQDSTHVTFGVGTLGFIWNNLKCESSIFTGREPDQSRWNFDKPKFDSYSFRLSWNLKNTWAFQGSYGKLTSPEQVAPDFDSQRITVSAMNLQTLGRATVATTGVWGRKINEFPGHTLDSFLLESSLYTPKRHVFMLRFERVEEDELLTETSSNAPPPTSGGAIGPISGSGYVLGPVVPVHKLTLGYEFNLFTWEHMRWAIGGTGSLMFLDDSLHNAYGDHPTAFMLFTRVALR